MFLTLRISHRLKKMFLFVWLLFLWLGQVAGCNRRIAVAVDVSGSISVDPVTGKQRPGPAEIRVALKKTMEQYLFRDAGACVGIYRFATNASLVFDFAPVALADTRQRLLAAVDTLPFEMSYPAYFTNWEAAVLTVLADRRNPPTNWLYLVTDSSPTYSSDGEDHGPVDLHVRAAVRVSKLLQKAGTGVVGVGMGPEVKDAHLAAISGPCGSLGCFKGWNYFHVDSISRANIPLGQSIQDRFLSVPAMDEHAVMKRIRDQEQHQEAHSAETATTGPVAVAAPITTAVVTAAAAAATTPGVQHFVTQPPAHLRVVHHAPPVITRADVERHKRGDDSLSGGAIAAIVISCVLGFLILAIVAWLFIRWWTGEDAPLSSPSPTLKETYKPGGGSRLPPPLFRT